MTEETIETRVEAVIEEEDAHISSRSRRVTLESGVVLEVRRVPDLVMQRLWLKFPRPQPPMRHIVSKTGKEWDEPNPDDPTYKEAMTKRALDFSDASLKLMLLKGVKIISLPENIVPFEKDDEWEEELEMVGLDIPKSKSGRYVEWLRYRVVGSHAELQRIQEVANELSGVSEEDVRAAQEMFPRLGGGTPAK